MIQITNKINGKILKFEYAAAFYIEMLCGKDIIEAIEKVTEGKDDDLIYE